MKFVTEYMKDDGKLYVEHIEADDWDEARATADARGLGEEVTGELVAVIPFDKTKTKEEQMVEIALALDDLTEASRNVKH